MIEMSVAVQQKLDVVDREAQLGDAFLDQWRGFGQTAVEQDGASRSPNEERRYVGRADVVNTADDAEWLDGLVPGGALVSADLCVADRAKREEEENSHAIAAA